MPAVWCPAWLAVSFSLGDDCVSISTFFTPPIRGVMISPDMHEVFGKRLCIQRIREHLGNMHELCYNDYCAEHLKE